jgi:secreted PhoX family phosphatase
MWQQKSVAVAAALALSVFAVSAPQDADPPAKEAPAAVQAVEFIGMNAPATPDEKTDIYTKAKVKITYRNGSDKTYNLKYYPLMRTTGVIGGKLVGGLYDHAASPVTDADGPLASDSPDGNSLLQVAGMEAADPAKNNELVLVTHYEYRELPPSGQTGSFWSKLPATMSLARLDQDMKTGALQVTDYSTIEFRQANGLWIPCAASLSPWNTHLGSEEYEPDAKVRELGSSAKASDSDDSTDLQSFSQYYFGDPSKANAYHYGLLPEVTVNRDGTAAVTMHYALGRISRELIELMPDRRTAYMGDDGRDTGLFMFIADREGDLSSGALYAGQWRQSSNQNGGAASLGWIKLGAATDAEIKALVDGGIKFSTIFDASLTDPGDSSFKKVKTYTGTEWLRLKPGKEKAAAFLETRRYAAYLGATTEFSKMEGVSYAPPSGEGGNGKTFIVISRIEKSMADAAGDIQLPENQGGAIYELALAGEQKDTAGNAIDSRYVAKTMQSITELLGGWLGRDANNKEIKDPEGNRCLQDKLCGPDNLKFSPVARTLFIGEDTSRRNNNYLWVFNLDTRKLVRVLSAPRAAEVTGLQVIDDLNGFAYLLSNFQHPGEAEQKGNPGDDDLYRLLDQKWNNRKAAAIGYIGAAEGALPALK